MTTRPAMIMPYISDARIGDGYRTAFVIARRDDSAVLFVPSKLATVTVPNMAVEKARIVSYQPRAVRDRLLARVLTCRKHGHRFPRKATVELLRLLGTGKAAIEETVSAEPLPATIHAREQRIEQAERAVTEAAVICAIREKIEMQLAAPPVPLPRPRQHRLRYVHPDQLSFAL